MTVEFVVMFPVAIVLALTCVNAVLFFSECAQFDRLFRTSVCTQAASPAYSQTTQESCGLIQADLAPSFSAENLEVQVTSSGAQDGLVSFTGELSFAPTLFGHGRLQGAFGVEFPKLTHRQQLTVDVYRPGVFL